VNSFDLTIKGYNGKNLRLRIGKLNKDIDISKSRFNVKSSSISITLKKVADGQWDDIKEKKPMFGKKEEEEKSKEKDPSSSLMDMMKEMYNSGDDEMKRMIAQSWTKAQEEKDKKGK
jgi:calcyclin binding protein